MGYRFMLGWNIFTLLFIFAATMFSYRNYRKRYLNKGQEEKIEMKDIDYYQGGEGDNQDMPRRYNTRSE